MKKTTFVILPVIAGALLSGCVSHHQRMVITTTEPVTTQTTRTVVVTEAPPSPRVEAEGPAPSTAHVWIQGHWIQIDNRWVWSPGHWELRPRVNAAWVPGHWDNDPTAKGWMWTPGHWE